MQLRYWEVPSASSECARGVAEWCDSRTRLRSSAYVRDNSTPTTIVSYFGGAIGMVDTISSSYQA